MAPLDSWEEPKSKREVYKVWTEVPKINFLYFSSLSVDNYLGICCERSGRGLFSRGVVSQEVAALDTSSKQILVRGIAGRNGKYSSHLFL